MKEYLPSLNSLGIKEETIEEKERRLNGHRNQIRIKNGGNACPKCGQLMERRGWRMATEKLLAKPFYFAQWDRCICGHLQHYEKYKVLDKRQPWELDIFK